MNQHALELKQKNQSTSAITCFFFVFFCLVGKVDIINRCAIRYAQATYLYMACTGRLPCWFQKPASNAVGGVVSCVNERLGTFNNTLKATVTRLGHISTGVGQNGPGQYGPGQNGPGQYGPGEFGPDCNPGQDCPKKIFRHF